MCSAAFVYTAAHFPAKIQSASPHRVLTIDFPTSAFSPALLDQHHVSGVEELGVVG
jgi:hypothetical protein